MSYKNTEEDFSIYIVDIGLMNLPVDKRFDMGNAQNILSINMNLQYPNDILYSLSENHGKRVEVSGWGRTEQNIPSTNLKIGTMLLYNAVWIDEHNSIVVDNRGLVANQTTGEWPCQFDSGGEVILYGIEPYCNWLGF